MITVLAGCGEVTNPQADASASAADAQQANTTADAADVAPDAMAPPPDGRLPDPDAQWIPHTVFVTSRVFGANFGGVTGADAACNAMAEVAGVTGTFKAILVDTNQTLQDRIEITGPVRNVNGDTIAANATDFFAGTNLSPNNVADTGEAFEEPVVAWIGASNVNCNDWSTSVFEVNGGLTSPTNTTWTKLDANTACSASPHLQCISQ